MPFPDLNSDGFLPPGIRAASLRETLTRYGSGSQARERQGNLLRRIVEAAQTCPTIKRVLVWGRFVTSKAEPNDLDYSIVVSVDHKRAVIASEHKRFFVPADAGQFYDVDKGYLVIDDCSPVTCAEKVLFLCESRLHVYCGIVEISLRGERSGKDHEG